MLYFYDDDLPLMPLIRQDVRGHLSRIFDDTRIRKAEAAVCHGPEDGRCGEMDSVSGAPLVL